MAWQRASESAFDARVCTRPLSLGQIVGWGALRHRACGRGFAVASPPGFFDRNSGIVDSMGHQQCALDASCAVRGGDGFQDLSNFRIPFVAILLAAQRLAIRTGSLQDGDQRTECWARSEGATGLRVRRAPSPRFRASGRLR